MAIIAETIVMLSVSPGISRIKDLVNLSLINRKSYQIVKPESLFQNSSTDKLTPSSLNTFMRCGMDSSKIAVSVISSLEMGI